MGDTADSMRLILYTQYYRARTPERQAEIDGCLSSNMQHPALDRIVLLREPDAPGHPGQARMPVDVVVEPERLSYSLWLRLLRDEPDAIGILINADIALGEGFEHLHTVLNEPHSVMALSRYNPQPQGAPPRLNRFPHWTQDTWALRSDAPISDSLLYASGFPIGFPGCDNRIADVFWSHGLEVKNPCYFLTTLHHQADEQRSYSKNGDRLYGGVCYVHPNLAPSEASELEHTIWTRSHATPPGVLVNQKAIDAGVHPLLSDEKEQRELFLEQQKSTGLAWSHQVLGGSRSDHAGAWPLQQLLAPEGVTLELNPDQQVQGLQLRLSRLAGGDWHLQLDGQEPTHGHWQPLDLGAAATLPGDGRRHFLELALLQQPWRQLRLRLQRHSEGGAIPGQALLEVLCFTQLRTAEACRPASLQAESRAPSTHRLRLKERQLESARELSSQGWVELHRYNSRFALQAREGRIAFVDRFWPTAVSYRDPELGSWDSHALHEAFLWGFAGPALEWKPDFFSTEKLFPDQLNFWQYPCRTEQDAFERHQRLEAPFWDDAGIHIYVGMPWATWIDKKTFPDQLLEAYRNRIEAMAAVLESPLQVHSICQHIRWKEHPHRFEQAGINQLWLSHKEKGWDSEGKLNLHAWPLYAVNALDPERQAGLEFVPVEQKSIYASFKGAHMKHYPTDVRLRLKELAALDGYQIEVSDLWHFNKVVYNYQIANKESDKEAIEREEIAAYNQLLSQSLFSLCPGGAGPNTLRLWESLAIGSIPVVLSDRYEFPDVRLEDGNWADWQSAVVVIPEDKAEHTKAFLDSITTEEARQMQNKGRAIYRHSRLKTCFSAADASRQSQSGTANDSSSSRTQRLLVIGSSVSIQKAGYLPVLQKLANNEHATTLQVLNASLGGCSTEASLAYLKAELFFNAQAFKANLALIEKCPNERHQQFSTLTSEQKLEHEQKIYRDTLELCRWCLGEGMAPILVCSYFKHTLNASWDADEDHGYLRRCYERIAGELNLPLIDLHKAFTQAEDSEALLLDDVHLNENGALLMAREIAKELSQEDQLPALLEQDTQKESDIPENALEILHKGSSHAFSTKLLNTNFDLFGPGEEGQLTIQVDTETEVTGLFYISDQASSAISITADNNPATKQIIQLFDHMSFMPRVTYKPIRGLRAHQQIHIKQEAQPVDLRIAMESYERSKTFDPEADWAKTKYLQPLIERAEGNTPIHEKIIAIFGRKLKLRR